MAENIVKLVKTQRGAVKIYRNGYTYVKNRPGSEKIYWKCESRKCSANIITNVFTDIETLAVLSCSGEHNHEGMYVCISDDCVGTKCYSYRAIVTAKIFSFLFQVFQSVLMLLIASMF